MEFQKMYSCRSIKEAHEYCVMTFLGIKFNNIKYFIKITIAYQYFLWFVFSANHKGKWNESQVCLSGRIYYSFASSTKSEGRCTETLRHAMMKGRR